MSIHVVVVEDDTDMGFLFMNQLNQPDIHALHITSGLRAMEESLWSREPTVGLLDIMMPDVTGIEVAKWVREKFPEVPLVGVTALNEHSPLFRRAIEVFDQLFVKPVPGAEIVDMVRKLGRTEP